jgi:hypothetical protein
MSRSSCRKFAFQTIGTLDGDGDGVVTDGFAGCFLHVELAVRRLCEGSND